MGLFSTVLHIYKRSQQDIVTHLSDELMLNRNLRNISRINFDNSNFEEVIQKEVYSNNGIFLLVTQPHRIWTTIIEVNVNIEEPLYLYELTINLSRRLNSYALSFHLHDDDVLYYELAKNGEFLDGYNSNYQYFLTEAADRNDVESQRHSPKYFSALLPFPKDTQTLNLILDEGYWSAFDNFDLDEDGVPNNDKYFIDEENRFERIGKYLEIYSATEYPFTCWHDKLKSFKLDDFYFLKAVK